MNLNASSSVLKNCHKERRLKNAQTTVAELESHSKHLQLPQLISTCQKRVVDRLSLSFSSLSGNWYRLSFTKPLYQRYFLTWLSPWLRQFSWWGDGHLVIGIILFPHWLLLFLFRAPRMIQLMICWHGKPTWPPNYENWWHSVFVGWGRVTNVGVVERWFIIVLIFLLVFGVLVVGFIVLFSLPLMPPSSPNERDIHELVSVSSYLPPSSSGYGFPSIFVVMTFSSSSSSS